MREFLLLTSSSTSISLSSSDILLFSLLDLKSMSGTGVYGRYHSFYTRDKLSRRSLSQSSLASHDRGKILSGKFTIWWTTHEKDVPGSCCLFFFSSGKAAGIFCFSLRKPLIRSRRFYFFHMRKGTVLRNCWFFLWGKDVLQSCWFFFLSAVFEAVTCFL